MLLTKICLILTLLLFIGENGCIRARKHAAILLDDRTLRVTDFDGKEISFLIPKDIFRTYARNITALVEKAIQWKYIDTQGEPDAPPPANDEYLRILRVKPNWSEAERLQAERMGLTRFLEGAGAPPPPPTAYCTWPSVVCDTQRYTVTGLALMESNLTGTLATELLFLRNLESLNIYKNQIKGSMPVEYLRMTNLRLLYLGENLLTSLPLSAPSDPTSSSSFSASRRSKVAPLELLSAHSNPLMQKLPVQWHEAFRKLQKLDLAYTQLRGRLDSLPESIEELRLCHNNLTGRALGVSHLAKLLYLDVSHNQLIDIDLVSSPLQVVEVGFNQLRGELPARLPANISIFNAPNNSMTGNVTEFLIQAQTEFPNIKTIDLRMNKLTGQLPETGWSGLKKLEALGLSDNNLHGSIPVEFYTALQSTMISFNAARNQMTGTIATELGLLTKLQYLDLTTNSLRGTMPNEMLKMHPNLRLNFTGNLLTGTIPSLFCGDSDAKTANLLYQEFGCDAVLCPKGTFTPYGHATLHMGCKVCPNDDTGVVGRTFCEGEEAIHGDLDGDGILTAREILRILWVDTLGSFWGENYRKWADVTVNECELTGVTCNSAEWIQKIDLSGANICSDGNRRAGPAEYCKGIPSEIGLLDHLQVLQFNSAQFLRGTIPTEIGHLGRLKRLDLTGCSSLTGTLPTEVGRMTNLREIVVPHCRLSGSLPSELFDIPLLTKLHITSNDFTGTIPSSIGKLSHLGELMVSRNALDGSIPTEIGNAPELENIEFYHNKLSGRIPSELAKCSKLKRIDVFDNNLSGTIPEELASVFQLQIIHLKNNSLEGTIPPGFGRLPYLSWFDVSDNQISGTIPPSFSSCANLKDFHLSNNRIYDPMPSELCQKSDLNGGATKEHGCNGILCPLGTYSDNGYALDDVVCQPCPEGESTLYLGSTSCETFSDADILSIFYAVMGGPEHWPADMQWGETDNPCDWGGIECDENGEIESFSFPNQANWDEEEVW